MKQLYRLDIPDGALIDQQSDQQRRIASQSTLSGGQGVVTPLGTDPGEITLRGQLGGQYAALMATEIEELFSSDFGPVSLHASTGDSSINGYYALENIGRGPLDPRTDALQEFDGRLRLAGTRARNYRELQVSPTEVDNPHGNTLDCEVGIPSPATDVAWYNTETGETASADPVTSRDGEYVDVDVYDTSPSNAPYSSDRVALVYDIPYTVEGDADVKVWDDYQRAKFDDDGVCTWARVFIPGHDYVGAPVLDNGLLRVYLDRTAGLTAEEWDAGAGEWATISLPASEWTLADADLRELSPTRTTGILAFSLPSPDQRVVRLRVLLHRGRTRLQFDRLTPRDLPDGLVERLAPLADDAVYDAGGALGLRARSDVYN